MAVEYAWLKMVLVRLEEALAVIEYESKKDLILKADKYIKELDLMGFC